MTILLDFDGTCIPALPINAYNTAWEIEKDPAEVLRRIIGAGHELVLWTCRNNDPANPYNLAKQSSETSLGEAIRWFSERGIKLSGINKSPNQDKHIGTSKKALGDIIIDDTALGTQICPVEITYTDRYGNKKKQETYMVDWNWVESELEKYGII